MNPTETLETNVLSSNLGNGTCETICCYSRNADRKIVWQITERCNLACEYCFTPRQGLKDMSLAENLDMLERLKEQFPRKDMMLFAGREPLLYRGLESLIARASELGFFCSLSSSGELLTSRTCTTLKKAGLGKINLSLNSANPEVHIHTRTGSRFRRVVEAVGYCQRNQILVKVNITAMQSNIEGIENTLAFLASLGVTSVSIGLLHDTRNDGKSDLVNHMRVVARQYASAFAHIKLVVAPLWSPCEDDNKCPTKDGLVAVLPNGQIVGCNIYHQPYQDK